MIRALLRWVPLSLALHVAALVLVIAALPVETVLAPLFVDLTLSSPFSEAPAAPAGAASSQGTGPVADASKTGDTAASVAPSAEPTPPSSAPLSLPPAAPRPAPPLPPAASPPVPPLPPIPAVPPVAEARSQAPPPAPSPPPVLPAPAPDTPAPPRPLERPVVEPSPEPMPAPVIAQPPASEPVPTTTPTPAWTVPAPASNAGATTGAPSSASSGQAVRHEGEAAVPGGDGPPGLGRRGGLASIGTGAPGGGGDGTLALAIPGDGDGAGVYASYLALLRRRVQEAMTYPSSARRRGLSGTVHLEIALEPTGVISDVTLTRSSSHEVLDEAAIEAVRSLRRVPFPPDVRPRPLRVRLPVVFELR